MARRSKHCQSVNDRRRRSYDLPGCLKPPPPLHVLSPAHAGLNGKLAERTILHHWLKEEPDLSDEQGGEFAKQIAYRAAVVAHLAHHWADIVAIAAEGVAEDWVRNCHCRRVVDSLFPPKPRGPPTAEPGSRLARARAYAEERTILRRKAAGRRIRQWGRRKYKPNRSGPASDEDGSVPLVCVRGVRTC